MLVWLLIHCYTTHLTRLGILERHLSMHLGFVLDFLNWYPQIMWDLILWSDYESIVCCKEEHKVPKFVISSSSRARWEHLNMPSIKFLQANLFYVSQNSYVYGMGDNARHGTLAAQGHSKGVLWWRDERLQGNVIWHSSFCAFRKPQVRVRVRVRVSLKLVVLDCRDLEYNSKAPGSVTPVSAAKQQYGLGA